MIQMTSTAYYGVAVLDAETFNKLDPKYFISGCTDTVKFMCANTKEMQHLMQLGIETYDYCDWYKLVLEGYQEGDYDEQ
jgi:hypothetical protein